MAEYRISGVWKNNDNVITHYAVHTVLPNNGGYTRSRKIIKADAVVLLSTTGNNAYTWIWNYKASTWSDGPKVEVVGYGYNKYLRSDPDNTVTDNLAHLINYDWI